MTSDRPRVFLDINIGTDYAGRLVFELFKDKAPKTCENFQALCAGSHPPLSYKLSCFHRVINEFMIQGGDITKGDGTGGMSIYGGEFEDENLDWREMDSAGLLCMANRGRGTNSSQFFITLASCKHLNGKHTIFGKLVSGQDIIEAIAQTPVDDNDRPTTDIIVMHCGELERKKKASSYEEATTRAMPQKRGSHASYASTASYDSQSSERGRGKRRRSHAEASPRSRSRSPIRHGKHRKHAHNSARFRSTSPSPPQDKEPNARHRPRRSSDHSVDETFRGRQRCRPDERMRMSPAIEEDSQSPQPSQDKRHRNSPPSRHRHHNESSRSPGFRRRRSLPNHYERRRLEDSGNRYPPERESSHRSTDQDMDIDSASQGQQRANDMEWRRNEDRRTSWHGQRSKKHGRTHADDGRLGHDNGYGDDAAGSIRFKGRGSMKYRERH